MVEFWSLGELDAVSMKVYAGEAPTTCLVEVSRLLEVVGLLDQLLRLARGRQFDHGEAALEPAQLHVVGGRDRDRLLEHARPELVAARVALASAAVCCFTARCTSSPAFSRASAAARCRSATLETGELPVRKHTLAQRTNPAAHLVAAAP